METETALTKEVQEGQATGTQATEVSDKAAGQTIDEPSPKEAEETSSESDKEVGRHADEAVEQPPDEKEIHLEENQLSPPDMGVEAERTVVKALQKHVEKQAECQQEAARPPTQLSQRFPTLTVTTGHVEHGDCLSHRALQEFPSGIADLEQRLLAAQSCMESRLVAHLEAIEALIGHAAREHHTNERRSKRAERPSLNARKFESGTSVGGEGSHSPKRAERGHPWNDDRRSSGVSSGVGKIDSMLSMSSNNTMTSVPHSISGISVMSRTSRMSYDGSLASSAMASFSPSNAHFGTNSVSVHAIPEHQSELGDSSVESLSGNMRSHTSYRSEEPQECEEQDVVIRCKSFGTIVGMQKQTCKALEDKDSPKRQESPWKSSGYDPTSSQSTERGNSLRHGHARLAGSIHGSEADDNRSVNSESVASGVSHSKPSLFRSGTTFSGLSRVARKVHWWNCFPMIHPNSPGRTSFDFGSMLVLLYDSTVIPYQLAWNTEANDFFSISSWVLLIFWTFDMYMSFTTGYYTYGELEMRRSAICRRYLRTWFIFDFGVNVSDFIGLLLDAVDDGASNRDTMKVLRMFKLNRILRIMAFLRIVRIFKRMDFIRHRLIPEGVYLLSQIGKVFMVILWLNHILACIWYGLAKHEVTDTGVTWLDVMYEKADSSKITTFYEYVTAYHWSMTQMTPGSMEVVPTNSVERVYNAVCLILGLLMSICLISQISAKMVQHNMSQIEQTKSKSVLRRFLLENNVRSDLASRIQQQTKERMNTQKRLTARDVPALKLISPNIRAELMYNAWSPHLMSNQLFYTWDQLDNGFTKDLCVKGVELLTLAADDELFSAQSTGEHVYVSLAGEVLYIQEEDDVKKVPIPLEAKTWISEAALWITEWVHRGTLRAKVSSEVLSISAEGFVNSLRRHRTVTKLARDFSRALNTHLQAHGVHALSDLYLGVDFAELLLGMPMNSRELMTKHIIDDMRHNQSWTGWVFGGLDMEAIEQECNEGLCTLVLDPGPVRVLLQVTLKIQRADGRFLVQVDNDSASRSDYPSWGRVRLLGTRRYEQEHPRAALDRLFEGELACMADKIEDLECNNVIEWSDPSQGVSMKTKYIRANFHATLVGDDDETMQAGFLQKNSSGSDRSGSGSGGRTQRQRHSVCSDASLVSEMYESGTERFTVESNDGRSITFFWFDPAEFQNQFMRMGRDFGRTGSIRLNGFHKKTDSQNHLSFPSSGYWFKSKLPNLSRIMPGSSKTAPYGE